MRLRLTILIVLVLFFAAMIVVYVVRGMGDGTPTTSDEPLATDKFVIAYVELAKLAETMPIGTDEYNKERERILLEIGVTPAQVEETLAYYNERPDLWRPIWEEIQTRLAEQLEDVSQPQPPDTVRLQNTP